MGRSDRKRSTRKDKALLSFAETKLMGERCKRHYKANRKIPSCRKGWELALVVVVVRFFGRQLDFAARLLE
jgi:hypothetical protein